MKRSRLTYIAGLVIGICCIVAGLFLKGEDVKSISGVLIGVGAGLFSSCISNLLLIHMERKNPALEKQTKIDYNDERNTMIRHRAKAKAGDITQWLIMGIAYVTIFISAPLWLTFAVIAVFLAYNVLGIYLMIKYQKEL